MIRILVLVGCLACSDSPSTDSRGPSPAELEELEETLNFGGAEVGGAEVGETEGNEAAEETGGEAEEEAEAPVFNRAILGAYISIGDPVTAFPPGQVSFLRTGESPYLLVTPNISEQTPRGYQVEMQLPAAATQAPVSAEALHVKVNNQAGETLDVRGQVTFRSLDVSTGHVALVVEGETVGDTPLSVEVEVDARIRVVQE